LNLADKIIHHVGSCKPTPKERREYGVITSAGALVWHDIPQSQLQGLSTTIDALIALDPSPFKCKEFRKHLTSKSASERGYETIETTQLNGWVLQLQYMSFQLLQFGLLVFPTSVCFF
jgi:hypothetical protein